MKALIFPGQGSQLVGMGSELYNNFTVDHSVLDYFKEEGIVVLKNVLAYAVVISMVLE